MTAPASRPLRWLTAGLLFAAAGLSIALPFVSATLLTIGIGGVAIAAGVAQLIRLTGSGSLSDRVFRGFSALLYIGTGVWILLNPVGSEVSLTLFVGLLVAFEGVMELAAAAASAVPARGLVLIDGLITTLLGGLLVAQWPSDSLWALGTLFGVALALSAVNLLTAPASAAEAASPS
ncbi:DUF308 domain-containing protein [Synechococcus sp. CS-602]|uniref:DUF308 domain-containing protein n=1 Tax=Synechococcaceae TaxID=1890426 RepID=UPI0008FF34C9|nr:MULTISPECIES: DUF308 domain-containing protein [Synechococcaceae]MCT4363369.1 DUF308 domain-containing protein [Candidatus Regnicoccus frigidus MAG-AL1]APD48682.1 hypothetical protein BM449_11105 [Synechococcus sp. SynAce01]MCT0202187.1 DUF308 domain-containing protein [Synechococcus sp. CS-603]MCT0205193.1 DUF308 domain-containing protein [Synechococcus sp. CS-602]MCT0245706.1 DUF308 domain-containing protein [Synechococcus sp. CS-601]